MVSVHRRSLKRSTALSSTDAFWFTPPSSPTQLLDDDASTSSSSDDGSSPASSSMPAAHSQLLSDDTVSFENLKGYDHTESVVSYDNLDSYASDFEDSSPSSSDDMSCFRQKVSSVKHQGGGSWLLGFARLNHSKEESVVISPEEDEEPVLEVESPPGLVRVASGTSLESDDSSCSSEEDESVAKPTKRSRPKGVSFAPAVKVQPIPHSSTLSPLQRRKMYASSYEVRQNKIRNKKEYKYDGYDWRNVTEEWEMGVDMVTGELVHPAHEVVA